jgi:hypothetical protein
MGDPPHVSRRSTGITCTCLLDSQVTHPVSSKRTHAQAARGMAPRLVIFGRAHSWQVTTPAAQSNGPGSGHTSDVPGHHINVGMGSEGTMGGQQQHHVLGPWIPDSYAEQMPAAHHTHTQRDSAMYTPQQSQEVPPHLHHQQMPVTASTVPYQSAVHPHSLQGPGRYAQHMAAAHHSALHTPQPSQEAQPHLQHMPTTAPAVTVPYQNALQPSTQHQPWATDAQAQATHAQVAAPSLQSGAGDVFKTGNMGTSWQTPAKAAGSNGRDPWHLPSQAPMTSPGPPMFHGLHPSPAFDMQNGSMC